MRDKIKAGLLSVFMGFSSAASAGDQHHDHSQSNTKNTDGYEFQFSVGKGATKRYIPVDCHLLGKNGKLTSSFVKQMGVWGHLDGVERRMRVDASEAQKIFAFTQHLRPHGVSKEKIEKAVEHCKENYL